MILARIKLWAAAIGAAGLALLGLMAKSKRDGRRQAEAKAKEIDNEQADAIRDRVRDARRVPDDDLKFRD